MELLQTGETVTPLCLANYFAIGTIPTMGTKKRFESVTGWRRRSYCYVYFHRVYHYMLGYGLVLYGSFSLSFTKFSSSHLEPHRACCVNHQECGRDTESEVYGHVNSVCYNVKEVNCVMSRQLSLWAESINSISDEFQLVCLHHTHTYTRKHTYAVLTETNTHCNSFSWSSSLIMPSPTSLESETLLWHISFANIGVLFSSDLLLLYSKSAKLQQFYKPCKIHNLCDRCWI